MKNNKTLQKVSATKDDSGHWYVIPDGMLSEFRSDEDNASMVDSGQFDDKWGGYRTGGDINKVQLWAEI